MITPRQGPAFVALLPVKRFHGVGPKTAERMAALGIETGADLRDKPLDFLRAHFGNSAQYYHDLARGICHRVVRADRPSKSIGAERTFDVDLKDPADLMTELGRISTYAWERIERSQARGRTVTLKIKYQDFQIITRAHSLNAPVADREQFLAAGIRLLRALLPVPKGIRLLGLTLSKLEDSEQADEREPVLPL